MNCPQTSGEEPDFLAWQRGYGMTEVAAITDGDADGNGAVNADDLLVWTNHYGQPASVSASGSTALAAAYWMSHEELADDSTAPQAETVAENVTVPVLPNDLAPSELRGSTGTERILCSSGCRSVSRRIVRRVGRHRRTVRPVRRLNLRLALIAIALEAIAAE